MRLRAFTIYVWWLVSAVTSSGQILAGGGLAQMG
jgi:hypothetical protein